MATYFYDWESYSTGEIGTASGGEWSLQEQGTNWTATIEDNAGNQQLVHQQTSRIASGWTVSVCDEAGATTGDIEAVCRFTYSDGTASVTRGPVLIQSDGQAYLLLRPSANTMQLWRVSATGGSNVALESTTLAFSDVSPGTYVWVRFGRASNVIRAKIWTGLAADEPAAWQLEDTDTALTSVKAGFGTYSYTAEPWICDVFGVGTAGDTAPTDDGGNAAPVFDGPDIGAQEMTEGTVFTPLDVSGLFSDSDGDPLTYSQQGTWPARTGGGSWVSSGGTISGTPAPGSAGTYATCYVQVTDGIDTAVSDTFTVTVLDPSGTAPIISTIGPSVVHGGSFDITGLNLSGSTLAFEYSTVSVPQTITSTATTITVAACDSNDLPYGTISLVVTNDGETASATADHAPASGLARAIVDIPWGEFDQSIFEGGVGIADGDQVEYETVTNTGVAALVRANGTVRVASGDGRHTFDVRLWDESALEWGAATEIVVTEADWTPGAPFFIGPDIENASLMVGDTFSLDASALFGDPDDDIASYALVGEWPSWFTFNSTTGAGSGTSALGSWAGLQVQATDSTDLTANSNTFSITVSAAPRDPSTYIDRIAFRPGVVRAVGEGSVMVYAVTCLASGTVVTPDSMRWRLEDDEGTAVLDWDDATPGTSTTIVIPASAQQMRSEGNSTEWRTITVEADYGTDYAYSDSIRYKLVNQFGL